MDKYTDQDCEIEATIAKVFPNFSNLFSLLILEILRYLPQNKHFWAHGHAWSL